MFPNEEQLEMQNNYTNLKIDSYCGSLMWNLISYMYLRVDVVAGCGGIIESQVGNINKLSLWQTQLQE